MPPNRPAKLHSRNETPENFRLPRSLRFLGICGSGCDCAHAFLNQPSFKFPYEYINSNGHLRIELCVEKHRAVRLAKPEPGKD
jgi:hypothetical protein